MKRCKHERHEFFADESFFWELCYDCGAVRCGKGNWRPYSRKKREVKADPRQMDIRWSQACGYCKGYPDQEPDPACTFCWGRGWLY